MLCCLCAGLQLSQAQEQATLELIHHSLFCEHRQGATGPGSQQGCGHGAGACRGDVAAATSLPLVSKRPEKHANAEGPHHPVQRIAYCAAGTDTMRMLRTRIRIRIRLHLFQPHQADEMPHAPHRASACTKWWVDSEDDLSSFTRTRSWMHKVFRVMAQAWYRMTCIAHRDILIIFCREYL